MKEPDAWDPLLIERVSEAYHGEQDIGQARQAAIKSLPKNHDWRKMGPHAVCFSCHAQHSIYIGALKKLEKTKEGDYVITDIAFDKPR